VVDNTADVSVVIPVYNGAAHVRHAIESAQAQSGVLLDIICVNDGSTDGTLEILNNCALTDERIRVISQENQGLSGARNTGISAAKGRYLVFLDADDGWVFDGLKSLVNFADTKSLDMLLFDANLIVDDNVSTELAASYANFYTRTNSHEAVLTGAELAVQLLQEEGYNPNAGLYLIKRSYLTDQRLRFRLGFIHEDSAFTFSALVNASRTSHLKLPFFERRLRQGSIITSSKMESTALGYFAALVDMSATLNQANVSSELRTELDLLVRAVQIHAADAIAKLPERFVSALPELISSPLAPALLRAVQQTALISRQEAEIADLKEQNQVLSAMVTSALNSRTYRVGRLLISPLSIARRFFS